VGFSFNYVVGLCYSKETVFLNNNLTVNITEKVLSQQAAELKGNHSPGALLKQVLDSEKGGLQIQNPQT
jgi:hypothetical protein